jgi:tight adherence protein C
MFSTIPADAIGLIAVLAIALGIAVWAGSAERSRRVVLGRMRSDGSAAPPLVTLRAPRRTIAHRLVNWLAARMPQDFGAKGQSGTLLQHAGFESSVAPAVYAALRLTSVVLVPAVGFALAPRANQPLFLAMIALACFIGLFLPTAMLDRLIGQRRARIRRGVPDAMDLLLVCVEAGVGLDAAVLRVAREMAKVHRDLAGELLVLNRRVNAGLPREEAIHGLWGRTGVEELRALGTHLLQSEKWGTSIASVLRVYSDTARRKRRQELERKAATAPMKMLFPLAAFIFPVIFVVLLGPAAIKIFDTFGTM